MVGLPKSKMWPSDVEASPIPATSEMPLREAMQRVDVQELAEAMAAVERPELAESLYPPVEALRAVEAAVAADPKVARGRRRSDAIAAGAHAHIDSGRSVHVTSPDDADAAYEIADILHRRAQERS
jgi:hypothetical protein